jgi:hypothetical protein
MQTFIRLLAVVATTLFCSTAFAQTGKPRVSPAQTESYKIGKDSTEVLAYTITSEGFSHSWEKLVIPVPIN